MMALASPRRRHRVTRFRPCDDPPPAGATVDVIVVGSGGGGLAAAATAAAEGLDVVVLEKSDQFGGTTAWSGGGVWVPVNHLAARSGTTDSRESALTYLAHCAGDKYDARRAEAFVDQAPAMIRYFEEQGIARFQVAAGRPDYRPDAPGASAGGRTLHPWPFDARTLGTAVAALRPPLPEMTVFGLMLKPGPDLKHFLTAFRSVRSAAFVARRLATHFRDRLLHGRAMELANGNALVATLAHAALSRGARFHTRTAVRELVHEGGRVSGVRYAHAAGGGVIGARRGVILATGGFSHDPVLRKALFAHAPTGAEHASPAPESNTGDGLHMAMAMGAPLALDLADPAGWAPVSVVPRKTGPPAVFAHLIDRQKPGFIAVTRRGRRFVNESNSYHDVGRALIAACREEPAPCAWLVADHVALRRYGMGAVKPAPFPLARHLASGYLARGATPRELAQCCGIDPDGFEQTLARFNEHARTGHDPEFGRGGNAYNRYNGDATHQPNPCVAPIIAPPYYAVRLAIGELATFAGLRTDAHARVLDASGDAIAGLYAAGNDAATIAGGDYPGGGATLGPGMAAGYAAARYLATASGLQVASIVPQTPAVSRTARAT